MKKTVLIFAVIALVIGVSLFHDQVLAIFTGMTVMESLQFIVTFVLHVAVATIAAYIAYTLPEFVSPWMRALKRRRKAEGRRMKDSKVSEGQRVKGTTTDQLLRAYVLSQAMKTRNMPTASQGDDVHLNF